MRCGVHLSIEVGIARTRRIGPHDGCPTVDLAIRRAEKDTVLFASVGGDQCVVPGGMRRLHAKRGSTAGAVRGAAEVAMRALGTRLWDVAGGRFAPRVEFEV